MLKENLEFLSKNGSDEPMADEASLIAAFDTYRNQFVEAMEDDMNTADAISAIFDLVSAANLAVKDGSSKSYAKAALSVLEELCDVLGIFQGGDKDELGADIEALIEERQQARKEKNWARADEIRDMLAAQGITLKDTPQGVQVIRN